MEFSGWYLTEYWGDANTEVSSALLRFIQQHWWIPHRKENSIVHSWPTFTALYGPLFLTENPKDSEILICKWNDSLPTDRQTDVQRGFSLCMAEERVHLTGSQKCAWAYYERRDSVYSSVEKKDSERARERYLIEVLDNISLQFCDESSALVTGHCCCQLLSNLSWKTACTSFIGIWPINWEHRNKWGNQSMLNTLKMITGTKSSNNVLAHLNYFDGRYLAETRALRKQSVLYLKCMSSNS